MRLPITVFISGMGIMAVEMSASRLLAPYFGTSLFVWTNLIGIIMIALSVGYYIGGKLADKYPREGPLYMIIFIGSVLLTLIPFVDRPIMKLSISAISNSNISVFYGSMIASVVLFAIPLCLLGMVSPYAIRIRAKNLKTTGDNAGSIYALSTMGSIIGTFIPALISIPLIGTKNTILVFSLILMLISVIGLAKKRFWIMLVLPLVLFLVSPAIKHTDAMIYETESLYHYIQVEEINNRRLLRLNEGFSVHSIFDPESVLTGGVWDYFLFFPAMIKTKEVLIIGSAAGTISNSFQKFYPDIHIDGVEIDEAIISVGRSYFNMNENNMTVHVQDGRIFLQKTDILYDLILIDAYRQPYIPFHLVTAEFFGEVRDQLTDDGIMAINVGSTSKDSRILRYITNTVSSVFPYVYQVWVKDSFNYIVFASVDEIDLNDYSSIDSVSELFRYISKNNEAINFNPDEMVLTDDRAPVELLTDQMIVEYATR